jgi:hypothetical protein
MMQETSFALPHFSKLMMTMNRRTKRKKTMMMRKTKMRKRKMRKSNWDNFSK